MMGKSTKPIKLGLEKVLTDEIDLLKNQRVGLICNQASVNHKFQHAADLFFKSEINLTALFGPQHGIRGDVQDNMIETPHEVDRKTNLPVYSLYSETRIPTDEMLKDVDTLVVDLQDVGCRVYTFIYTMANAMKACARTGKKMIVLDRPNPINGIDIEGNVLEKGHESFVGQYPIPMRHGLTIGELGKLFNQEHEINCELEVIKMDGWKRELYADETDFPWVNPSPNIPTVDTAVVFPATVFLEGTQISEGRGTTRPFEILGAPFINADDLADALNLLDLSGVIFRSIKFLPTFQKHSGRTCEGVFIHVTDRKAFNSVICGIEILKSIFHMYPEEFAWKNTPYEYEFERNPFDVIAGTEKLRKLIEANATRSEIEESWESDLEDFIKLRDKYLLY